MLVLVVLDFRITEQEVLFFRDVGECTLFDQNHNKLLGSVIV